VGFLELALSFQFFNLFADDGYRGFTFPEPARGADDFIAAPCEPAIGRTLQLIAVDAMNLFLHQLR
jgi:hypothetical protein